MPDDPEIRDWDARQPVAHERLNALQRKAIFNITAGKGMRLSRKGNSVAVGLTEQPRRGGGGTGVFPVVLGVPAGGDMPGGVYTAYPLVMADATPLNIAQPLTSQENIGGNINAGTVIQYAINLAELGKDSHDLMGARGNVTVFAAFPHPVKATDGTAVCILIAGFDWTSCAGGLGLADLTGGV